MCHFGIVNIVLQRECLLYIDYLRIQMIGLNNILFSSYPGEESEFQNEYQSIPTEPVTPHEVEGKRLIWSQPEKLFIFISIPGPQLEIFNWT